MGKRGKKKKSAGGGDDARGDPKNSWSKNLADSLGILSWDGATDADLVTVCVQLSPIVGMLEKLGGFDPSETIAALAPCCAHSRLEVRVAAWKALAECGLESQPIAEAAVEAGLHKIALLQFGDVLPQPASDGSGAGANDGGAGAASRKAAGLRTQLLQLFRLLCETSDAATESVGSTELRAICECITTAGRDCGDCAAALELLLVLTDSSGPAALPLAPVWLPIARTLLVKPAEPDASTAALVGVITLNVVAALDEADRAAGEEETLEPLVDICLRTLGKAALGEATDAMRSLALEHLSNIFVKEDEDEAAHGADDATAEDDAPPYSGEPLRRRAVALLPAEQLLLSPRGLLRTLAADLRRGRKRPRSDQAGTSEDGSGGVPGASPSADTATAARCMQCAGTVLVGCADDEVLAMAAGAWQAVSDAAGLLAELGAEAQEALLELMSCLALRSAATAGPPIPASQLWSLGLDAVRWFRAVKGSEAMPLGVALLGQMLALLPPNADGAPSELAEQLLTELRAAVQMRNALAAAEAFAALSETGVLDADSRTQLPQIRAKLAARTDERAAQALELLDAAARDAAADE